MWWSSGCCWWVAAVCLLLCLMQRNGASPLSQTEIYRRELLLPARSSHPDTGEVHASLNKMLTRSFLSDCMMSAISPSGHKAPAFKLCGEIWCGLFTPRACRAEVMTGCAWLCLHCFLMPSDCGTDDSLYLCGVQPFLTFESACFPSAVLKNCSSLWFFADMLQIMCAKKG